MWKVADIPSWIFYVMAYFEREFRFQMVNISVKVKIKMHISLFPYLLLSFLNCICIKPLCHWYDSSLRHKLWTAQNISFPAVMSPYLHHVAPRFHECKCVMYSSVVLDACHIMSNLTASSVEQCLTHCWWCNRTSHSHTRMNHNSDSSLKNQVMHNRLTLQWKSVYGSVWVCWNHLLAFC